MSTTDAAERRRRFREWMGNLTLDALEPDSPLHVRLGTVESSLDPVYSEIELALTSTAQLITGPSGSGKSTELRRFAQRLEEDGFVVAYVDVLEYVNQTTPVDITDLLIVLGVSICDALGFAEEQDGPVGRFKRWLRETADSALVTLNTGPASVEFDVITELKENPDSLDGMRLRLAAQLPELRRRVEALLTEAVTWRVGDSDCQVVAIVDSLEKLRGTSLTDDDVQASVERVFVQHGRLLRFGSHHSIYTVPPYLKYASAGAGSAFEGIVRMIPVPRVTSRPGSDQQENTDQLIEVIERRLDWNALVAERADIEELVRASGGHLRDLMRILRELINLVNGGGDTLPVGRDRVLEAIAHVAGDYGQLSREDADFLRGVRDDGTGEIEPGEEQIGRMARLLDQHMLLAHGNGDTWYEVHPLAQRAL